MNTPFGNSITTAEHAIAMMFALAREIPAADASTQAGKWEKNRFMGVEITGKTLGIIGCGNIGSIVADRAPRPADAGHRLRPVPVPRAGADLGVEKVELDELLARADFITLHTPMTPQTQNILPPRRSRRPRRASASSTAPAAAWSTRRRCAAALESRPCRGRGLRRLHEEPAKENPLFGLPNVVCTPHLGAATNEAQENVALQVAEQMSDYLIRGAISNAINFPSITAEEAPRLKPFIALAEKLGSFAGQLTESRHQGSAHHL